MPTVEIEVRGGVAEVVGIPEGVRVILRDYDVEGCSSEHLDIDENGDECVEGIYTYSTSSGSMVEEVADDMEKLKS